MKVQYWKWFLHLINYFIIPYNICFQINLLYKNHWWKAAFWSHLIGFRRKHVFGGILLAHLEGSSIVLFGWSLCEAALQQVWLVIMWR